MSSSMLINRAAHNESLTISTSLHFLIQNEEQYMATILVIDDNAEISYFLAKKLLPSFGYKTLQAGT